MSLEALRTIALPSGRMRALADAGAAVPDR